MFTSFTVPSPAFNVSAIPQTPESIKVLWQRPLQPNGAPQDIRYILESRWSNDDGITSNGRFDVPPSPRGNHEYYSFLVQGLDSEHTYNFKVGS